MLNPSALLILFELQPEFTASVDRKQPSEFSQENQTKPTSPPVHRSWLILNSLVNDKGQKKETIYLVQTITIGTASISQPNTNPILSETF